jgi:epoxyqueuosine reductase
MKASILGRALELGFDDCRFTAAAPPGHAAEFKRWLAEGRHGEMGYLERNSEKRLNPGRVLPGARTIITLAASYAQGSGAEHQDCRPGPEMTAPASGLVARYARFDDYHRILGGRLELLAQFVNQIGGPGARSLSYVDTGPLLERDLAERAGLGFIGKHTNLISRRLGNWFFLAEILTTLELDADVPEKNHCGSCSRCLQACPTAAIIAPFRLDAPRCLSYLTIELKGPIPPELRPGIGNRIFGCDDCLAACPWNRFAREGRLMKQHARPDLSAPGLLELLALDEDAFQRRFAGSPVLRTKRRGLRRNVCVALGNIGDPSVIPALEDATLDADPVVGEHAAWAIDRIRSRAR